MTFNIKLPYIFSDLKTCFHPQNEDISHSCFALGFKGTYMVTYDIENNSCNWFYQCENASLTKNVFKSISACRKACVKKKSVIRSGKFICIMIFV